MRDKSKVQDAFFDNPESKQLFFFGFYVVFFIFIVILLRSSFARNDLKLSRSNSGYRYDFTLRDLEKKNYHFNYKVIKNGEIIVYDGNLSNNKRQFFRSGNPSVEYYSVGDVYYQKNSNTLLYDEVNNPMEFVSLLDASTFKKFFIYGSYISKTEYLDGNSLDFTYNISTSTLLRNIDKVESDIDGEVNKVVVKVISGKISEVSMDLTDYFRYHDNSINEYKLVIGYSKFGEIGDIDVGV